MPQIISVDQIVIPTSKWQVTIPKKLREKLDMKKKIPLNATVKDGKLVMVPIKKIVKEDIWNEERRRKLLKALREVRGMWADDDKGITRIKKQRKRDLKEIKKLRKAW